MADNEERQPQPGEQSEGAHAEGHSRENGAAANGAAAQFQTDLGRAEVQLKRALADLDNYRKRFDREVSRLREQERETIFRDLLPILDNLERALATAPNVKDPWHTGVDAVHRQLLGLLQRYGVAPVEDKGRRFDPEWHDVVATVPSDAENGTIMEVAERGYRLGERPLRHARVVVAAPSP